jgi:hypothetical protein
LVKGYPLARLLKVREHRVEVAKVELSLRRRLTEDAAMAATETERIALEFAANRPLEAARLFSGLRGKITQRKDLDHYHEKLAAMAAHELELFGLAEQARTTAKAADAAMKKAESVYRTAVHDVDKFKQHRKVWQGEERKRAETAQEQEMDETAELMAGRK